MQSVDGRQYISLCIENTETHDFRWYDTPLTGEEEDIIMTESNFVADAEGIDVMPNSSVEYHIAIAEDIIDLSERYNLPPEVIQHVMNEFDEAENALDSIHIVEATETTSYGSIGNYFASMDGTAEILEEYNIESYFDMEHYGREQMHDFEIIHETDDQIVILPRY